mgnify:CR=1 FL=1
MSLGVDLGRLEGKAGRRSPSDTSSDWRVRATLEVALGPTANAREAETVDQRRLERTALKKAHLPTVENASPVSE